MSAAVRLRHARYFLPYLLVAVVAARRCRPGDDCLGAGRLAGGSSLQLRDRASRPPQWAKAQAATLEAVDIGGRGGPSLASDSMLALEQILDKPRPMKHIHNSSGNGWCSHGVTWCGYSWKQAFSDRFALAHGTFANVLQAKENSGGQVWAMKTVSPSPEDSKYLRGDFLTELCIGTLRPMPVFNTPVHKAFEWLENGTSHYALAMPRLLPIKAVFQRRGVDIKNIMAQVAFGLWRLHTRGIIHHDVGRHNVMARDHRGMQFSLIDYGLAHVCNVHETRVCGSMDRAGTFAYMAPSVAMGAWHSFEVDWYSWGQLLVESLLGETVLDRILAQHGTRRARKLALQNVQLRYHMLEGLLHELVGIPSEVTDLVRLVIGPDFEDKLSTRSARLAMQSSDIDRHPVLGHSAWLLETWGDIGSRGLWRVGGAFWHWRWRMSEARHPPSIRAFWRGLCERHAEHAKEHETCHGIFSRGIPRRVDELMQIHANACPRAIVVDS
mmetsp:Transcript_125149/g.359395  ORF Transcript_125149/g.359395 Transcript_125149/m.359395 type:complete len:496 (+) Transcript_125149:109-1596(+)